jgi:nicotinate-nucleotide adenylyltransferase
LTPRRGRVAGVLGGTFDPVHLGHLHAARAVRSAFELERVLLVPSAAPPHKVPGRVASASDRLAMLRIAVADIPGLEVATIEIDRGAPSYTIDTLRALRREAGIDPLFIVGSDALLEIRTWREAERILEEFDLVAVDRPGALPEASRAGLDPAAAARRVAVPPFPAPPPGHGGRIFALAIDGLDVSSTEVRRRAAAGQSLLGLVPPAVDRYIHERKLYLEEALR